jgi:hypothetical protein
MTVTEHAETISQDVLRRLRVSVRHQPTARAAEHGVSTHVTVVVHMPTAASGAGLRRPLLADLQQQQQWISSVQT